MTVTATAWEARCDHQGCGETLADSSQFALRRRGDELGWKFNRKLDGTPAQRNGRDFCPTHSRTRPKIRPMQGLSAAAVRHLLELLEHPAWRPRGAEWLVARTMDGAGLVAYSTDPHAAPYTLTPEGRDQGETIRAQLLAETNVAVSNG